MCTSNIFIVNKIVYYISILKNPNSRFCAKLSINVSQTVCTRPLLRGLVSRLASAMKMQLTQIEILPHNQISGAMHMLGMDQRSSCPQ